MESRHRKMDGIDMVSTILARFYWFEDINTFRRFLLIFMHMGLVLQLALRRADPNVLVTCSKSGMSLAEQELRRFLCLSFRVGEIVQ